MLKEFYRYDTTTVQSFFVCSFSSAETQWIHFLGILGQLVDQKLYCNDKLENLNWDEKCRLIQSDPVTCARHFDYQVNNFQRHFLQSNAEPLGKISDWFIELNINKEVLLTFT